MCVFSLLCLWSEFLLDAFPALDARYKQIVCVNNKIYSTAYSKMCLHIWLVSHAIRKVLHSLVISALGVYSIHKEQPYSIDTFLMSAKIPGQHSIVNASTFCCIHKINTLERHVSIRGFSSRIICQCNCNVSAVAGGS